MTSPLLLGLIRTFEGCRLSAYLCPAGKPTIGYGSTGKDIQLGMVWTLEQAEERLQRDALATVVSTLSLCPKLANDENRLAAVADFAYNLGSGRLAASTLRRKVNNREWLAAANEFPKWVRGGGKILPGLVSRREAERRLFLGV